MHLVAEIIFIFLIVYLTGSSSKLGYTADFSQVSGSGEFECVMTEKALA